MPKPNLRDALKARQKMNAPEPEPAAPVEPATKPKAAPRFHTSVYLDKGFYNELKIALIREGQDRDFNGLVNDLLREWCEANGKA